jgi:predicted SAM-dependent methyltransferase
MIKNVVKKLFPDYAVKAVQEARSQRAKNALLKNSAERATAIVLQQQDILLELGAGYRKGANGWTTIDICPNCDIYCDLRLPLPFPANSITKIYSSHVLEHFDHPDLMKLLAECHRILKPHGMFSVCVPDASIYIKGYVSVEEFTPQNVYKPAFCINTRIDFVNYIAYMGGHHRYMFDRENLLAILRKAGFKDVRARQFESAIDKVERDWESIYAEAEK